MGYENNKRQEIERQTGYRKCAHDQLADSSAPQEGTTRMQSKRNEINRTEGECKNEVRHQTVVTTRRCLKVDCNLTKC